MPPTPSLSSAPFLPPRRRQASKHRPLAPSPHGDDAPSRFVRLQPVAAPTTVKARCGRGSTLPSKDHVPVRVGGERGPDPFAAIHPRLEYVGELEGCDGKVRPHDREHPSSHEVKDGFPLHSRTYPHSSSLSTLLLHVLLKDPLPAPEIRSAHRRGAPTLRGRYEYDDSALTLEGLRRD